MLVASFTVTLMEKSATNYDHHFLQVFTQIRFFRMGKIVLICPNLRRNLTRTGEVMQTLVVAEYNRLMGLRDTVGSSQIGSTQGGFGQGSFSQGGCTQGSLL